MGKNFIVSKKTWCPLSDIMDAAYDHAKAYTIYVNSTGLGMLKYLQTTETPTLEMYGRDLPDYSSVNVAADTGDHIYFMTTANPVNIYIEDV